MLKHIEYQKIRLSRRLYKYSKVNSSFANASTRNNLGLFAESYLEFYHQKKLEIDSSVKFIEAQPFTMLYHKSSRPNYEYNYTPDCVTVSFDDEREVQEVKASVFLNDEVNEFYRFVEGALREHAIGFRVITEKDLGGWQMMSNIHMLSGYVKSVHSKQKLRKLADSLPRLGTYDSINAMAMKRGFQPTITRALIAMGYFMFDMNTMLNRKTLIYKPSVLLTEEVA